MNTTIQPKKVYTPDESRSINANVRNYHVLIVSYIGASEHKGSRVKIHSDRFKQSVIVSYDHYFNNTLEIATHVILNKGFNIVGHGEADNGYFIITDTFQPLKP